MSLTDNNPERPFEGLPPAQIVDHYIGGVGEFAQHYRGDYAGNALAAMYHGLDSGENPLIVQMFNTYAPALRIFEMQQEAFLRQGQALYALGGNFYDALVRTDVQTKEFMKRDKFEQLLETTTEASWRQRIVDNNYTLARSIPVPYLAKNLQLCATPRIRTILPNNPDSLQFGHIGNTGGFQTLEDHEGKPTSAYAVHGISLQILSKLSLHHAVENNPNSLTAAEKHRQAATDHLRHVYRRLWERELPHITYMDAIGIMPGIPRTNTIESVDFFLNVGEAPSGKGNDYRMALVVDGQRINEQYFGANVADRIHGQGQANSPLPFTALPETLPDQPRQAFTREAADMNVSLIAVPTQRHTYYPGRPVHAFNDGNKNIPYQLDPKRPCFLGHISLVGSY